jgi:solute carrier family 35, member F1/2
MLGCMEMDEDDDHDNENRGTRSNIISPSLITNGDSPCDRQQTTTRMLIPTDNSKGAARMWAAIQSRRTNTAKVAPRRKWIAIVLGQIIALAAASTNAVSYSLSNFYHLQIQVFQLLPMYALLSLHLLCREPIEDGRPSYVLPILRLKLRVPWLVYLFISVLDVVPNLLQLLSFRFTSLTSTTLLGSLTVPSTMLFSYLLLAKRFGLPHYVGACLCVVGGVVTGWSDSESATKTSAWIDGNSSIPYSTSLDSLGIMSESADAPVNGSVLVSSSGNRTSTSMSNSGDYAWVGDVLAISSALLYGLGDSVAEYSIKHIHRQEYLGMIGLFGTILTALAFPFVDGGEVAKLWHDTNPVHRQNAWLLLVLYTACVFFYYISAAWFYTSSDATLLNLSLLTSNLWVLGFSVLAYRHTPPPLFFVAAILVVTGVIVYQNPLVKEEDDAVVEPAETENLAGGEAIVLVDASPSRSRRNSDYESI